MGARKGKEHEPHKKMGALRGKEHEPHKDMGALKGKAVLIHPWSYSCNKFDDKS
jgi:hypothetical protein